MANTVREGISASHIPQVSSAALGHALSGQQVLLVVLLAMVLTAGLVVFPAIWSADQTRRKAALEVLDRIMRWRL